MPSFNFLIQLLRIVVLGVAALGSNAHAARATDDFIQTKPYRSLAIAIGVGAVVGFFSTRKRENDQEC